MQYADVAIRQRMGTQSRLLTYSIPPELLPDIQLGVVVDVPFRTQTTRGIVVALRAHIPDERVKKRLRPIRRVISPWPLLGDQELRLRTELAAQTASPTHLVTTLTLPPPSLYRELLEPVTESAGTGQTSYIMGDFRTGLKTLLPKINQGLASEQSIVILAATKSLARELITWLKQEIASGEVTEYDPQSATTKQLKAWQIALGALPGIVIGTRSAILLPFRQLSLIIILDPTDRQLNEEQTPEYQALAVADLRRRLFGADVISLGALPPLAMFTPALRKHVQLTRSHHHQPKIIISARNRPKTLQETTLERIHELTNLNQHCVIVVPRRGWAAGMVCQECGEIIRCQTCGHLLHVQDATTKLRCEICHIETHEAHCNACGSPRLTTFGWGSQRFIAELQKLLPDLTVISDETELLPRNWHLLVTTPERLGRSLITAELIIAVEPERILLSADYKVVETYIRQLYDLRQRSRQELIIETRLPDQAILGELQTDLPRETLRAELVLRKAHGYPPFGALLTIIWEERGQETKSRSAELIHQIQALSSTATCIGPSLFTGKSGKLINRLLIKLPDRSSQVLLSKIIDLLPAGTRWRLEK